jgi:hypothetical protein
MIENQPALMRAVSRASALALLGGVSFGRIVFTQRALPAICPVNHVVDDGDVLIRVPTGAPVLHAIGQVVAYEADSVSDGYRLDWSVVVIGVARLDDGAAAWRPEPYAVPPAARVVRIRPELVTGYVLTAPPDERDEVVAAAVCRLPEQV